MAVERAAHVLGGPAPAEVAGPRQAGAFLARAASAAEGPVVHRRAASDAAIRPGASEVLDRALERRGGGARVPDDARVAVEQTTGASLGNVRVHSDPASHAAAEALGAEAFTVGSDIYFGRGKYAPSTTEGWNLLAHELAHTAQNAASTAATAPNSEGLFVPAADSSTERAADAVADAAIAWNSLSSEFGVELSEAAAALDAGGVANPMLSELSQVSAQSKVTAGTAPAGAVSLKTDHKITSPQVGPESTSKSEAESGAAALAVEFGEADTPDFNTVFRIIGKNPEQAEMLDAAYQKRTGESLAHVVAGRAQGPWPDGIQAGWDQIVEQLEQAGVPIHTPQRPTAAQGEAEAGAPVQALDPNATGGTEATGETEADGRADAERGEGGNANQSEQGSAEEVASELAASDQMPHAAEAGPGGQPAAGPGAEQQGEGEKQERGLAHEAAHEQGERSPADGAGGEEAVAAAEFSSRDRGPNEAAIGTRGPRFAEESNPEARQAAEAALSQALAGASQSFDSVSQLGNDICSQLDEAAQQAAESVRAEVESQVARAEAQAAEMDAQLEATAAEIEAQLDAKLSEVSSAIEAQAASQVGLVDAARDSSLAAIDASLSTQMGEIARLYANIDSGYRAAGQEAAQAAVAESNRMAAHWLSQVTGESDSLLDGPLTDNRLKARAEAAKSVGEAYRDELIAAAEEQAQQAAGNQAQDEEAARAVADQAREAAEQTHGQVVEAIEAAKTADIESATTAHQQSVEQLQQGVESARASLTTDTAALAAALRRAGEESISAIIASAERSTLEVRRLVDSGRSGLSAALERVASTLDGIAVPNAEALAQIVSQIQSAVATQLESFSMQLQQMGDAIVQGLMDAGQQALESVTSAAEEGISGAATSISALIEQLQSAASQAEASLGTIGEQSATRMTETGAQGVTAVNAQAQQAEAHFAQLSTQLSQGADQNTQALREALMEPVRGEMPGVIRSEAEKAAAEVQPRWRSVLKWVLIIAIVIVVAVVLGPLVIGAITGVAAGLGASAATAAAVGAIVGGAVVGAATSGAITVVDNAMSGRDLTQGLGTAMMWGAIGGAVGGAVGAFVPVDRIVSTTLGRVALQTGLDATVEVGLAIAQGGLTWDNLLLSLAFAVGLNSSMAARPGAQGFQARMHGRGEGIGHRMTGYTPPSHAPGVRPTGIGDEVSAPTRPIEPDVRVDADAAPTARVDTEPDGGPTRVPETDADATTTRPDPEMDGVANARTPEVDADGQSPYPTRDAVEAKLDEMYAKAPEAEAEITALANSIADDLGGAVTPGPLKGRERALQKIQNDYADDVHPFGDPTRLKDMVRNTIIVDADAYPQAVARLEAAGARVKRIDASTDPLGYSGSNSNLTTQSGLVAEIQVNTPEMIYAKEGPEVARAILGPERYDALAARIGLEGGQGHTYYEDWRSLPEGDPRRTAIEAESREYYDTVRSRAQGEADLEPGTSPRTVEEQTPNRTPEVEGQKQPGIQVEEGMGRVGSIRTRMTISKRKNIAVADVRIEGQPPMELIGVSGQRAPSGTVEPPALDARQFETITTGKNTRQFDSEAKILEHLATVLDPNATGTINLFTERDACISCRGVISQFRQRYPNITVNVSHGP